MEEPAPDKTRLPSRPGDSSGWRELPGKLFDMEVPLGRRVESVIGVLIVASLVTVVAETVVEEGGTAFLWLERTEFALWVFFCVEYALRIAAAPVRRRYIFSFYGVVDLLAVISGVVHISALGVWRALRILRSLRVFKLVRYSSALERFSEAYQDIKDELALYLAATAIMTFMASYGIWELEHEENETYSNIFECVYWAVTSVTAGAENMVPVTVPGKILSMLLVLLGLGIVAVPSGLLASALSKQDPKGAAADAGNEPTAAAPVCCRHGRCTAIGE